MLILVLICGVIFMYLIPKYRPDNLIESKMSITLPTSSKIINFSLDRSEGNFDAKILITDQNIEYVKEQLNKFFGGIAPSKATKSIPNFKNTCPWWDLEKQDIEASYVRFIDERKLFTRTSHEVWTFISKDGNGDYYLYISY